MTARSADTANDPTIRWVKSSYSDTMNSCVEVAWVKSSFCHGGTCVEVGWTRASKCSVGDCLEAAVGADMVLVRDSKLDDSPVQEWPRDEWQFLLDAIELGIRYGGFRYVEDGNVRLGWARLGQEPLTFNPDEWKAFVYGVRAGEFDAERLSRVEPTGDGSDQAATGAGEVSVDLTGPVPVAAALQDSSAPAVAEDRPVTGDRSEAGTGVHIPPAPVPAADAGGCDCHYCVADQEHDPDGAL